MCLRWAGRLDRDLGVGVSLVGGRNLLWRSLEREREGGVMRDEELRQGWKERDCLHRQPNLSRKRTHVRS